MRIKMVSLEDGITSNGFRKVTAFVHRLEPDSTSYYVSTHRFRSVRVLVTSAVVLGVAGHFKIYPVVYALPIWFVTRVERPSR